MIKKSMTLLLSVLLVVSTAVPAFAVQAGLPSGDANPYVTAAESLDNDYAYSGELGALYTPERTTFRVWAPTASEVELNRYATGSDSERNAANLGSYPMEKLMDGEDWTGVWTTTIEGDIVNTYYTYTIKAAKPKSGQIVTSTTQDVYSYAAGVNGNRTMVVDLDATDPAGWENDMHILPDNPAKSFVWETHVKDFSYDESSGVSEKNRGKFLAFTETGTTLNGEGLISTGIDYLKELGVTTVQILPFFDYSSNSVDETKGDDQFNWGYDPVNYNVPEGSYSSNPYDGNVRIRECKQMIKALHDAGISVVMDVVYNHTASSTDSPFGRTVPEYYYRMNTDGTFSNGSGCGNETASKRAMFRKFMIDSIAYWANEYHIDGFRFDLMALHDVETLNLIREKLDSIDSRITMWGEGWTGGNTAAPAKTCSGTTFHQAFLWNHPGLSDRVGFFNDGIRNAIKGDTGSIYSWGWVQGAATENTGKLVEGMQGQKDTCYSTPGQAVTYDACHDNCTLWDQLCASQGLADHYYKRDEKIAAQNKLAGAILNLSQGTTFILAGEEMGRSKGGDHNSYKSSPDVNKIRWELLETNADIVSYYKGLREIRKNYSLFTTDNRYYNGGYDFISTGAIVSSVCTNNTEGEWNKLLFIANTLNNSTPFEMPYGYGKDWVVIADDTQAGVSKLYEVNDGHFEVAANSVLIAIDRSSFYAENVADPFGKVNVKFVDTNTNKTFVTKTLTGTVGTGYSVYTPQRFGNEYVLKSVSGNTQGNFTEDPTDVAVNYTSIKEGTIKLNYYISGTQQPIHASDTFTGMIGDKITIGDAPAILGYEIDPTRSVDADFGDTITITPGTTVYNYYYRKITDTVKLHFKHSASLTWNPILWVWGRANGENTENYCSNQNWPGDTLYDQDGDGWFDKTFTTKTSDDYYNLIISDGSGNQTTDYTGLTQSELWIVIDDDKFWNYADRLTIYTEEPINGSAPIAQTYGPIRFSRVDVEPSLLSIHCPDNVTSSVDGYTVTETIPGAKVELKMNGTNSALFKGFSVSDSGENSIDVTSTGKNTAEFFMPESNVEVKALWDNVESASIDLTEASSEEITAELAKALQKLPCYNEAASTLDLNGDGKDDIAIKGGISLIVVRLPGADYTGKKYTFELASNGYSEKYSSVEFLMNKNVYNISFNANGGTGTTDGFTYAKTNLTVPDNDFTAPKGSIFSAWEAEGETYAPGDTAEISGDTVFTAVWEKLVHVDEVKPTCTEDGSIEYYKDSKGDLYLDENATPMTDKNNDGVIDINDTVEKATGHDYGEPQWQWNDDFTEAAATFTCKNDSTHTKTVNAQITDKEEDGKLIHTAEAVFYGKTYTDIIEEELSTDNIGSESDSETTDTESDTQINSDTDSEEQSDSDTEEHSDSDTETDSDTDPGFDTDTETDPDTDTDSDEEEEVMIGDADKDNSVTSSDALKLLRASIGLDDLSSLPMIVIDVTGDNSVDSADALEVLRFSVGLSNSKTIGTLVKVK